MISQKEHEEILKEFEAFISIASGEIKEEGLSIKHDAALARTFEWLRDSYVETYEELKGKNKQI